MFISYPGLVFHLVQTVISMKSDLSVVKIVWTKSSINLSGEHEPVYLSHYSSCILRHIYRQLAIVFSVWSIHHNWIWFTEYRGMKKRSYPGSGNKSFFDNDKMIDINYHVHMYNSPKSFFIMILQVRHYLKKILLTTKKKILVKWRTQGSLRGLNLLLNFSLLPCLSLL